MVFIVSHPRNAVTRKIFQLLYQATCIPEQEASGLTVHTAVWEDGLADPTVTSNKRKPRGIYTRVQMKTVLEDIEVDLRLIVSLNVCMHNGLLNFFSSCEKAWTPGWTCTST